MAPEPPLSLVSGEPEKPRMTCLVWSEEKTKDGLPIVQIPEGKRQEYEHDSAMVSSFEKFLEKAAINGWPISHTGK